MRARRSRRGDCLVRGDATPYSARRAKGRRGHPRTAFLPTSAPVVETHSMFPTFSINHRDAVRIQPLAVAHGYVLPTLQNLAILLPQPQQCLTLSAILSSVTFSVGRQLKYGTASLITYNCTHPDCITAGRYPLITHVNCLNRAGWVPGDYFNNEDGEFVTPFSGHLGRKLKDVEVDRFFCPFSVVGPFRIGTASRMT